LPYKAIPNRIAIPLAACRRSSLERKRDHFLSDLRGLANSRTRRSPRNRRSPVVANEGENARILLRRRLCSIKGSVRRFSPWFFPLATER
jgi:hypothetical protein